MCQDLAALSFEDTWNDFSSMIQACIAEQSKNGLHCTCFGIGGTKHDHGHARVDNRPSAHGTRFQCDVQRTVSESPITDRLGSLCNGDHFRVRGGIMKLFALIVGSGDDTALMDNHSSYRDFT